MSAPDLTLGQNLDFAHGLTIEGPITLRPEHPQRWLSHEMTVESGREEISLCLNGEPMVRFDRYAFWVRGHRVEAGPDEARAVFEGFKAFLEQCKS